MGRRGAAARAGGRQLGRRAQRLRDAARPTRTTTRPARAGWARRARGRRSRAARPRHRGPAHRRRERDAGRAVGQLPRRDRDDRRALRRHDQDDPRPPHARPSRPGWGHRHEPRGQEGRRPDGGRLLRAGDLVLPAPLPGGGRRGALPHPPLGPGAADLRRPRVEGAVRGRRELRGHGRRDAALATTP